MCLQAAFEAFSQKECARCRLSALFEGAHVTTAVIDQLRADLLLDKQDFAAELATADAQPMCADAVAVQFSRHDHPAMFAALDSDKKVGCRVGRWPGRTKRPAALPQCVLPKCGGGAAVTRTGMAWHGVAWAL